MLIIYTKTNVVDYHNSENEVKESHTCIIRTLCKFQT